MRRAKIVATLGPATSSLEQIRGLVAAGMDVARLNLSHGSHDVHLAVYNNVRAAADEAGPGRGHPGRPAGPEDPARPVRVRAGAARERRRVHRHDRRRPRRRAAWSRRPTPGCRSDVTVGDLVLVDDGRVELKVTKVEGNNVHTVVVEGGRVSDNKGFNLPGVAVSVPALSEKDRDDLRWALRTGADLIALSFVRSAADVADVHEIMDEEGVRLPVLAKVEKPQAIENLEEIIAAFDGVMVARGDLGVELPLEAVPARAEAGHPPVPRGRQAGHRRDADARLDGRGQPPDPRRGQRRRQRRARRRRCADAVGRDQRRRPPEPGRRDDEPHHRARRDLGPAPAAVAVRPVDRLDGPCPDARGGRRRRGRRRHPPDRLHRDRARPPA